MGWDSLTHSCADLGSNLPGRISTGMYNLGLRPQHCIAEEGRKPLTCRYLQPLLRMVMPEAAAGVNFSFSCSLTFSMPYFLILQKKNEINEKELRNSRSSSPNPLSMCHLWCSDLIFCALFLCAYPFPAQATSQVIEFYGWPKNWFGVYLLHVSGLAEHLSKPQ